jgi:hypothetical protein
VKVDLLGGGSVGGGDAGAGRDGLVVGASKKEVRKGGVEGEGRLVGGVRR